MYSNFFSSMLPLLNKKISALEQQINSYPDGYLSLERNGPYVKWFHRTSKKRTYIPKKNYQFAQQLILKNHLMAKLEDLKEEVNAIHSYLQYHNKPSKQEQFFSNSLYRDLYLKTEKSLSDHLQEWSAAPYNSNPRHPENKTIKTISGNLVRSKSEALIEQSLITNGIPYRYECLLEVENLKLYPDFTTRHRLTGKVIIWEHLGMMDNPQYVHTSFNKIEHLIRAGFIPGENLILTFESKNNPLTPLIIEETIARYY
ncbi:hypothetical protein [Eubacterium oxidoreducens]|uniref:Uncharacterized protein n=1 Tax=Eubacterium oxidoreducens TaxID=1732 RepID=A0A1G6CB73_EUBOX|nr:hypothetical protein [Eubacterium oxidoreducens]SDB30042.1 hypothetical protein SAMN02910417_02245 [Eubacterium oxidoreducens]